MKFTKIIITTPNENLLKFLQYLVELTAEERLLIGGNINF